MKHSYTCHSFGSSIGIVETFEKDTSVGCFVANGLSVCKLLQWLEKQII